MEVFKVKAPDGTIIKVRAVDRETAIRGAKEHYAGAYGQAREKVETRDKLLRETRKFGPIDTNAFGDFTAQVARNTGAMDDVAAGINYAMQGGENLIRRATGKPIEVPARVAAKAAADYEKEQQRAYAKAHPVGNAFATGATIATSARPLGPSTIRNPIAAGLAAATQNAPFAVARQEGRLKERLPGAAAETALTFGIGSTLQAGANAFGAAAAGARARPPSNARRLAERGVTLTPGQMAGGAIQRVEDGLTSVPIVGDSIRAAKIRGIESFDRAAINTTLAPINAQLAGNANVGREGVTAARQAISDAYNTALTGVQVAPDQQLSQEFAAAANTPNLTGAQRETLDTIMGDMAARFQGPIDGDLWKVLDSDLRKAIQAADNASANQPGGNLLTSALQRLRQAHQGVLERANPQVFAAVRQADEATANLARINQASQYTGTSARGGVFTPSDLNRAVQGMDTSAGNRAFAQGDALMQDLTDPAMQVLPQTVPDSGTPLRSLLTAGGLTGGGMAVGLSPEAALVAATSVGAGAGLYSRPVQGLINAIYRAKSPGQARGALAQLAQLAARDPALVPAYEAAARQLGVPLPERGGQPSMQRSLPQPTTP